MEPEVKVLPWRRKRANDEVSEREEEVDPQEVTRIEARGSVVNRRKLSRKLCFVDILDPERSSNAGEDVYVEVKIDWSSLEEVPPPPPVADDEVKLESAVPTGIDIRLGDTVEVEGPLQETSWGGPLLRAAKYRVTHRLTEKERRSAPVRRREMDEKTGQFQAWGIDGSKTSRPPPLCRALKDMSGICPVATNGRSCPYRHEYLTDRERELAQELHDRTIRMRAVNDDVADVDHGDKERHSARAKIFVEWFVETFGEAALNGGTGVLDVAGGRGDVSYNLTMRNVKSTLIEPRTKNLKRKQRKQLKKQGLDGFDHIARLFLGQRETDADTIALMDGCSALVGMHPDQATEPIIDYALATNKPCAVCPCCVFPNLFPDRRTPERSLLLERGPQKASSTNTDKDFQAGTPVVDYPQLIEYLLAKDASLRVAYLPFIGRNKVIYRLPEKETSSSAH